MEWRLYKNGKRVSLIASYISSCGELSRNIPTFSEMGIPFSQRDPALTES